MLNIAARTDISHSKIRSVLQKLQEDQIINRPSCNILVAEFLIMRTISCDLARLVANDVIDEKESRRHEAIFRMKLLELDYYD